MTLKLSIGGTDRPIFLNSLKLQGRLGNPASGSFDMREDLNDSPVLVTEGQEVIIYDDVLTETIRKTIPGSTPPGIRYEADHEGKVEGEITFNTLLNGCIEGVFANLYNLPDLTLFGVEGDFFLIGGAIRTLRIADPTQYTPVIEFGLMFKVSDKKYYYYARFPSITYPAPVVVSTTSVELDVSRRVSVTWETNVEETSVVLKLYIDGDLEGTTTAAGTMRQTYDAARYWVAWMSGIGAVLGIGQYYADVRIWYESRTAAAIHDNAFSRLTGADLTDPDLELYWMCDEMTGTTVGDSSPGGNDGTLYNDGGGYLEWAFAPDDWLGTGGVSCADAVVPFRYFGGRVDGVRYELQEPDVLVQHIKLTDYSEACNRHVVAQNFMSSHDGKYYAQYLGDQHLKDEGIGYGCIPDGSPVIMVPDWTTAYVKKALDDIYTSTAWIWYIDPYKELRYHPRGYKTAPWDIADADSPGKFLLNSMTVDLDKSDYYNRLKARIRVTVLGTTTTIQLSLSNDAEIAARKAIEGGSGIYEHAEDITNVSTVEQGLDLAQGKLTKASTMGKTVTYRTLLPGLRPGMIQTIANTDLGLSGTYLIEAVNVSFNFPNIEYSVTASSWLTYKNSALVTTLAQAFNSAKNWSESSLSIGTGYVIPETATISIEDVMTAESGDISAEWDVGYWDFTEWA